MISKHSLGQANVLTYTYLVELVIEFLRNWAAVAVVVVVVVVNSCIVICAGIFWFCFPFSLTHTMKYTVTHILSRLLLALFVQISTSGLFCFLSISARTHSALCPHKFDTFISIPLLRFTLVRVYGCANMCEFVSYDDGQAPPPLAPSSCSLGHILALSLSLVAADVLAWFLACLVRWLVACVTVIDWNAHKLKQNGFQAKLCGILHRCVPFFVVAVFKFFSLCFPLHVVCRSFTFTFTFTVPYPYHIGCGQWGNWKSTRNWVSKRKSL